MRFIEINNHKKFILISVFLFFYIILNLFHGERGLVSYYNNNIMKEKLIIEKESLTLKLDTIENENSLLTDNIDLDYLEILYRKKFLLGKSSEKVFIK